MEVIELYRTPTKISYWIEERNNKTQPYINARGRVVPDRKNQISSAYRNYVIQLYNLAAKQHMEDYQRTGVARSLDKEIYFKTSNPGFGKMLGMKKRTVINFFSRIQEAGIITRREWHGRREAFVLFLNPELCEFTEWVINPQQGRTHAIINIMLSDEEIRSKFKFPTISNTITQGLHLSNTLQNNLLSNKAVSGGGKPPLYFLEVTKQAAKQAGFVPGLSTQKFSEGADEQASEPGVVAQSDALPGSGTVQIPSSPAPEIIHAFSLAEKLWVYAFTKIFHRCKFIAPIQQQETEIFFTRLLLTFSDVKSRPALFNEFRKRIELSGQLICDNLDSERWTECPLPSTWISYGNASANGFLYSKTLFLNFKESLKQRDEKLLEIELAYQSEKIFKKAIDKCYSHGQLRVDLGETYLHKHAPDMLQEFYQFSGANTNALQEQAARKYANLPSGFSHIKTLMDQLRSGHAVTERKEIKIHPKYLKK